MKIRNIIIKNLVLFGAVLGFSNSCTSNNSEITFAELAIEESLIQVRPGMSGEQPFWNSLARRFIQVPSFEFNEIESAKSYKFSAYSETDGKTYTFLSKNPQSPLSPIWLNLPIGKVNLIAEALDENEKVIGVSGTRQFYKAAPFNGPYQSSVLNYKESAKLALQNLFHQDYIQHWVKTGKPDSSYELYCYASKLFGAVTEGMILYSELSPEDSLKAVAIAKKAADYLIRISEPADAPLAYFPPTYQGDKLSAAWFNGQIMMNCPSEAARIYLNLFDVTGDEKYFSAAIRIAETYLKLQLPNGTWKLKLYINSGKPVDPNETIPIDIVELYDRLIDQYNLNKYQSSRSKALKWISENPLKTFNWEGQYEDIILQGPYQNMTKHQAGSYAIYILEPVRRNAKNIQIAKELLRFAEDQFVIWERPLPDQSTSFNWLTPCVLEQYRFYEAVDASASKLIATYQALYNATGEDLYLAKAVTLANNMTVIQKRNNGIYSTWWRVQEGELMEDWANCAVYDTRVVLKLSELIDNMNRNENDLSKTNLLLLLSQPPTEQIMAELVNRYYKTNIINKKNQLLRYIAQSDMRAAQPILLEVIKGTDEKMKAVAISLIEDKKSIADAQIILGELDSNSTVFRNALLSSYTTLANKYVESGNTLKAREIYHKILKNMPDFFDARHSLNKLEKIGTTESLNYIKPYLDSFGLSQSAATAILKILLRNPDQLQEEDMNSLLNILVRSEDLATINLIIDNIQNNKPQKITTFQNIAMQNGYVSKWWVAGPFSDGNQQSDTNVYFPEKEIDFSQSEMIDDENAYWQIIQPISVHGVVPFAKIFGKRNAVAYAYTEITMPEPENFVFKIGSNDGVVCWVNKKLMHSNIEVGRALKLDEDVFVVNLKKGKNTILLKVPNVGGNWETCLKINNSYDKPLDLTPFSYSMKTAFAN